MDKFIFIRKMFVLLRKMFIYLKKMYGEKVYITTQRFDSFPTLVYIDSQLSTISCVCLYFSKLHFLVLSFCSFLLAFTAGPDPLFPPGKFTKLAVADFA